MRQAERLRARLQELSSLPQTLDVSFDAFEFIRLAARAMRTRSPSCFRRSSPQQKLRSRAANA